MIQHLTSRLVKFEDRRQRHYAGRVLLVSARVEESRQLAESLNRRGFCSLDARTALDAYRWASEVTVSIIITDVELPGDEDGFHLTRQLKQDDRTRTVPVVAIATRRDKSLRTAARHAGCDLISSTASPRALTRRIERLVSRSRQMQTGNARTAPSPIN